MFKKGVNYGLDRIEDSRVSYATRQLLYEYGYNVQHRSKNKYRRMKVRSKREIKKKGLQPIIVNQDYSSLQYLGIVRHYVQKNTDNIRTLRDMELLLYLYPFQMFSKIDYDDFPHPYSTKTMTYFLNNNWIEPMFDKYGKQSRKQVYKLTREAKTIVRNFYDYLHGAKPIPEKPKFNKLFDEHASGRDMVKAQAIADMNRRRSEDKKLTPEHKKLNKRMMDNYRANREEKTKAQQPKIDAILEKRRLEEKKRKMKE